MVLVLRNLARSRVLGLVARAARWPWPEGWRPMEQLAVAGLSGSLFLVGFLLLIAVGELFASPTNISLFFPVAGLCFLFGYLLGPVYLPVPILLVPLLEASTASPLLDAALHIARQMLLYGGAGVFLRSHLGRRPASGWTCRVGTLLLTALAAVFANTVAAMLIYLARGNIALVELWPAAVTFFLGDLGGFILVVPPAVWLLDRILERRNLRTGERPLTPRARLIVAGLVGLVCLFVVGGVLGVDHKGGMPASLTPALLPILAGAVLFGYAVGIALFSFAGLLLLGVSWLLSDPPSLVTLQTVLVVCGAATMMVGAATSDRTHEIGQLDAVVADRTRQLDARNAVLSRVNAQLKTAAATDYLTGLKNRRAFELALAERLGGGTGGVGLMIIDIDRFKRINDRFGHGVGDQALVHVAQLLTGAVRTGDVLARIGGEEFAVICRYRDAGQLHDMAERLRRAVRNFPLQLAGRAKPLAITVSIGGATASPSDDMESLLRAADRALYAAKRAGRDRTRLAAPPDHAASAAMA